jgi:hypothetical protein
MAHRTLVLLATATFWALPAAANPAASCVEAAAGLSRGSVDCTATSPCDRSSSFGRLTLGHGSAPGLGARVSMGVQADRTRVTAEGDRATLALTGVSLRMTLG